MDAKPIGQVRLRFGCGAGGRAVREQLSAVASDSDGNLWFAGDEDTGLSRLRARRQGEFGEHRHFDLTRMLSLCDGDRELDIEGLDWQDGCLWLAGSHTSTRKAVEAGRTLERNLDRLASVKRRLNRFVIGCVGVVEGEVGAGPSPRRLPISGKGNPLTKALRRDPHLSPFLRLPKGKHRKRETQLASKENGFDIEGLAVCGDRLFLGLRGPVLRGFAMVLEIEPEKTGAGELRLKEIGKDGRPYRKHFVHLGGMGVRDLIWQGDDLLILAGPTMDITGLQTLYRLRGAARLGGDSLAMADDPCLQPMYHLPVVQGGDKAEGLVRYDGLGEPGLMVVYDSPRPERLIGDEGVLADVYPLPGP